ncbi:MAG: peptidylprolyl isomerase [Pseudomonadota bacterium]
MSYLLAALGMAFAQPADWRAPAPEHLLYLDLESGRVVIELAPDFAPNHAANMQALVRSGFYDDLAIYRVVDGFVAQGGDVSEERVPEEGVRQLAAEFTRSSEGIDLTELAAPDPFADRTGFWKGFPVGIDDATGEAWIVHCTGTVAIARSASGTSAAT